MCQITPSEVAVAVDEDKTQEVQFVSVNGGKLVKGRKLKFKHRCNGIAHYMQDLYLTSWTALYKYSMKGDLLNKLYEDKSSSYTVNKCEVSPAGDKIFVTYFNDYTVLTLDRDGTLLHTFTDPDLLLIRVIHVAALGQVLVCACGGVGSDTIIQLDGEGKKKLANLYTRSDGLDMPWTVCYNTSTASILVGPATCNKILVLKVK